MKISGVAVGQWNQICKKKEGIRRTTYKIHRAIVMGNVAHTYMSKDYVIRYHDMNILVSHTGLIMTIWRDTTTAPYEIKDKRKVKYDVETTHKENIKLANQKHQAIVKHIRENDIYTKHLEGYVELLEEGKIDLDHVRELKEKKDVA